MSQPPGPPAGPPYPPPYGGPLYYGAPGPMPTNGKATASLVVGATTLVLSWCCGFGVLGLVAVGLGAKAKSEIRRTGGVQPGNGLATAGIATGVVAALLGLVVIAALIAALAYPQP